MKRGLLTVLVTVFMGTVFFAGGAFTAPTTPDGDVTIGNEGYKTDKKGPVVLSHGKHYKDYGVQCEDCHHVYEGGENVWKAGQDVQKCSACHDPQKKQGDVMKLQIAYHKNCKNCHKALKDKKAPFKKCSECHQKK
jgi:hypothetical protein